MLTGNLVSLLMGGIICYTVSMIWPEDYDFVSMRQIRLVASEDGDDEEDSLGFTKVSFHIWGPRAYIDPSQFMGRSCQCKLFGVGQWPVQNEQSSEASFDLQDGQDSPEAMEQALNFVLKWGGLLAIILIPIWPLLALPAGVFSEGELAYCGVVACLSIPY